MFIDESICYPTETFFFSIFVYSKYVTKGICTYIYSEIGKFDRVASNFRETISEDHPIYQPESQRYHLYISLACPWANRCSAILKLKGS